MEKELREISQCKNLVNSSEKATKHEHYFIDIMQKITKDLEKIRVEQEIIKTKTSNNIDTLKQGLGISNYNLNFKKIVK